MHRMLEAWAGCKLHEGEKIVRPGTPAVPKKAPGIHAEL